MADLSVVPEDEREHPAYTSFVVATAKSKLTRNQIIVAWSWYKEGWTSAISEHVDAIAVAEEHQARLDDAGHRRAGK